MRTFTHDCGVVVELIKDGGLDLKVVVRLANFELWAALGPCLVNCASVECV